MGMIKFILISDDEREEEYLRKYPKLVQKIPFDDDGEENALFMARFESIDEFGRFTDDVIQDGSVEIYRPDPADAVAATIGEGAPILSLYDKHVEINWGAWKELLEINREPE